MRSRSWAELGAVAVAALALGASAAGCGDGSAEPSADARLTVYVSVPERGPSAADGLDVADGARLALRAADGRAADVPVQIEVLDDSGGGPGGWSAAATGANARRASQDSTAIAYVGDFDSGATRVSLPVTNGAGMLQVSPASGAGDLVAPFPGSTELPETQPSGSRTFGRVIPSDVRQAQAAAAWVDRLGVPRIATLDDRSTFGRQVSVAFRDALTGASVVPGEAGWIFYAGEADSEPPAARDAEHLLVTDAELGAAAERQPAGTLATSAALDPSQLPAAAAGFKRDFEAEYGGPPGRYAAYGYEAMAVVLDSIERADDPTDRGSVIDAFFDTAGRDAVIGSYTIDELGETSLDRMTGYRLTGGKPRPVARLRGGP